jgi:hypothetical protein
MTIKSKVEEYKAANPNATDKEIAKACETNALYVYQILRPKKGTKPTKGQKILRTEIINSDLHIKIANNEKAHLHSKIDELEIIIKAMNFQMRGLQNVITYLETKLGIDEIDARLEATRD